MGATNAWLLLHVYNLHAVTCMGGGIVLPQVLSVQVLVRYKLSADLSIPRITCWQLCGLTVGSLGCFCMFLMGKDVVMTWLMKSSWVQKTSSQTMPSAESLKYTNFS